MYVNVLDEEKLHKVIDLINSAPYIFYYIGVGISLSEEVDGIKFSLEKNKKIGGLNIYCSFCNFHLHWDRKQEKWVA